MTAASNPAAELTEAEVEARMGALPDLAVQVAEDVWTEDEPTLAEYEVTAAILAEAARLAAGGAATTDDGLRALVDEMCAYDDPHDSASAGVTRVWGRRLRRALDAAPAPTEDASKCPECGWPIPTGVCGRCLHDRTADTAAEEPRTEAQTAVRVLREAIADHEATFGIACSTSREWLRARADRLSRADEEAGS